MRLSTKITRLCLVTMGAAALLSADSLTLRSGQVVQGTFIGGTARQVRMDLNGETRAFDITDVVSISFSDQAAQATQPAPRYSPSYPPPAQSSSRQDSGAPRLRRAPGSESSNGGDVAPPPPPPLNSGMTIPVDTSVSIRMIDAVDSERARTGQTFRASLDEPIFVSGQEAVPRGADVLVKLVEDQQSGKIEGRTKLTLALSTITINGRPMDVTSTDVSQQSGSRGARSAKVIGGTAALGAIIGAVAGGGKGAAIGAGSGAAVGTGAEVLTAGQKVKIPSETRLVFRLQNPVQL
jgi:hypothetical protein